MMQLNQAEDLYEELDELLQSFSKETNKAVLHEVLYY